VVRDVVLALDRAVAAQRVRIAQEGLQIIVRHPQQRQVEILSQQPCDLVAQHRLVPVSHLRQLVVGDAVGPALRLVEMAEPDHRDLGQPEHGGRQHPAVPGDQLAVVGHHAGHGPAELRHAGGDLRDLVVAVHLGVLA
jgi:hypothetical protein